MSFNWKELQDVGDHLQKMPSEAYQRSAIGRYYYSCYAPVRDYFENVIRILSYNENSHQAIIFDLCNSNDKKERDLGEYLSKLRRYRNNADYHMHFKKNNVYKAQETAKEIHNLLDVLVNEKKQYGCFKFK